MPAPIRVLLFNTQPNEAKAIRQAVTGVDNVRIIAELDDVSELSQAAADNPFDLLLLNLCTAV